MTGAQADTDDGRPEPGGVRLFEPIGHERHENARLLFDAGPRRAGHLAASRHDPVLLDKPRVVSQVLWTACVLLGSPAGVSSASLAAPAADSVASPPPRRLALDDDD